MWFSRRETVKNEVIYTYNKVVLIKCDCEYLKSISIKNWSKNRPPDNVRVNHISKYYKDNNIDLVPGIIYLWEHPKTNMYIVYDGIHRLLSAFESGRNMIFIVNVIKTDNEQDVIDEFININKSISVPSIYLEDTHILKKMVCQNVADELCRRYPTFVSASRKPFVYNFNRDNLVEFISSLNLDFLQNGMDKIIINELIGINHYALDFVKRNNIKTPKKCDYHKFYLFYLDRAIIKDRLEKSLK